MLKRRLFLLSGVAGCSNLPADVYLLVEEPASTPDCTQNLEENFDADPYENGSFEEDPDWSFATTDQSGSRGYYIELLHLEEGGMAMNYNEKVIPGTEDTSGNWIFEWDEVTTHEVNYSHQTGYQAYVNEINHDLMRFTWTIEKNSYLGAVERISTNDDTYTEIDQWELIDQAPDSLMPFSAYVDGYNGRNVQDCTATDCSVHVIRTCASTAEFNATRVTSKTDGVPLNSTDGEVF